MEIKLTRYKNNPILMPTRHKWENKAVFNCGAAIYKGRVALLYRAQGDDMISRFGLAFSDDGYHIAERLPDPVLDADHDTEYEALGIEDPRISIIGDSYYIVYTSASLYPAVAGKGIEQRKAGEVPWRVRVSIAHTTDFRTFTRHGVVISHIDSKDGVLFPGKFHNKMLLLHRVIPDIRLAIGENITGFAERGPLLGPGSQGWDATRVGAGAPPIKTEHGWVLIYHGVDEHGRYSIGLALIDLHDPLRVIARSKEPILYPTTEYEKKGQVPNVVFACGTAHVKNELLVYYGAADSAVGVASIEFDKIEQWAEYHYRHAQKK